MMVMVVMPSHHTASWCSAHDSCIAANAPTEVTTVQFNLFLHVVVLSAPAFFSTATVLDITIVIFISIPLPRGVLDHSRCIGAHCHR